MMRPISRRSALQLGGLGLAGTVVGATGLAQGADRGFALVGGARFVEPPVLASAGGRLQVRLEAARDAVKVAGRAATVLAYNGGLPGPTLRLQPGDRLQVRLVNRLGAATNLHVHGLHVSPEGNGDNIFLTIEPGKSFDYEYQLPADHPPGTFWYHPHLHGSVAEQVFGGLYGAIVVADPSGGAEPDPVPVSRERVLVISDISLDGSGQIRPASAIARVLGREGDLILVNGQARPELVARPGERERWRIVNACAARYLRLRLDGQQLRLLGLDSGRFPTPRDVTEVVLAPGNRADLLVTATQGASQLRAMPYDRGGMMGGMGNGANGGMGSGGSAPSAANVDGVVLATFGVKGSAVAALAPVPAQRQPRDLRGETIARRRELVLQMGMGGGAGMVFTIDGRVFDANRVDQSVKLGTVEEWTLTNASSMDHPLHLHVWPMQLLESGGGRTQPPSWQDVVNVPARSQVTVRVAFDEFAGRTVYHCHILDHEDTGMMGVVTAR